MRTLIDLHTLDGANVLVQPTQPTLPGSPVAIRGIVRVADEGTPPLPVAEIEIAHPAMFSTPAFEQVIPLDDDDIEALLASERSGTFTFVYHGTLDAAVPRWPVTAHIMHPLDPPPPAAKADRE